MSNFGPFTLANGTLAREGKTVTVGQRALALLEALAGTDGPVDKAGLIEAAWPGTIVEEGNLTVQIAALRKALGTRPDGQEWIVTVPRVGYRLLRDAVAPHAGDEGDFPRLAVLPFQNLDGDPAQDGFADGLVEELVNALGRFRGLEIVSRHLTLGYRARITDVRTVAAELGARYLLEGAVRRAGGTLRVTAQLVDGASGSQIWTDRLDAPATDVFAVQDEVTHRVAGAALDALQTAEVDRALSDRTPEPSAYTLYLQALSKAALGTESGNAEGARLIQRSLDVDPHYGRACSYGAMILSNRVRIGWPNVTADDRAAIASYVERGVVNARRDARVMAECSDAMIHGTREYVRGLELSRRACEVNPFDTHAARASGIANILCGDLDEALDCLHRAFRLSPQHHLSSPTSLTGIAHVWMIRGDYAQAVSWAAKSLAISAAFDATFWMLIAGNAHLGRLDEARRYLADLLQRAPHETIATIKAGQPDFDPTRIEAIIAGLRLAGMPEE